MTAYTGGPMSVGFGLPVVVDLASLRGSDQAVPILLRHSNEAIVGHTDNIVNTGRRLTLTGVASGAGAAAQEVIESSRNGFPWQASVGVNPGRVEEVKAGSSVQVNGRTFRGPLLVARDGELVEVSFVARGADRNTSARVAASIEGSTMEFSAWLKLKGFDEGSLRPEQRSTLEAAWRAEANAPAPAPAPAFPRLASNPDDADTIIAERRAKIAAENDRVARIQDVCKDHPAIAAQAIREGWSPDRADAQVLRAERQIARPTHSPSADPADRVQTTALITAALCLSLGLDRKFAAVAFGEKTIEASNRYRHLGLKDVVALTARMADPNLGEVWGDGKEIIRASFSGATLTNILGNTLGKLALAAYQAQPIAALALCRIGSVRDFKQISRHRLLGTGRWERVAETGELRSGQLDEQTFTSQADTFGQMLKLTRKEVINDDLGMLGQAATELGRGGRERINEEFFTLLLGNPNNFFSAGNGNLVTGSDTAFGLTGLNKGNTAMRKQKRGPGAKAADKRPINVTPDRLAVPVELDWAAEQLLGAPTVQSVGTAASVTTLGTANPVRNRYSILSHPAMSDSSYTGNSAAAYYLFANPADVAAFEAVFLNGVQEPTVEQVPAGGDELALAWRGYIDFGVSQQDPAGAVKIQGT